MPTRLLKHHLDDIMPIITAIVIESLLTGVFPTCLKPSLIRPLLKKPYLDQEILKSYRPIANISFLAKIIEKDVALQTYSHLETNKLMPPLQSAYRRTTLQKLSLTLYSSGSTPTSVDERNQSSWNDLPLYIKQSESMAIFKKNLKKFLFCESEDRTG